VNAERTGVFISHINEEAPVALVLKRYLALAFGEAFPVFVSSDKESIEAGDEWYQEIMRGLTEVETVIVLLSQESARRGWINFEGGVGRGAGAKVIPMVLSRYSLSQVPFPLAGLQGRLIDDLGFVIDSIATREGLLPVRIDIDEYQAEIRSAETQLNYKSLIVNPVINGQWLEFDIENVGNVDIELLMLEALIPPAAISPTWSVPNQIDILGLRLIESKEYRVYACYSPRGTFNTLEDQRIWYQLHAVGYTTLMEGLDLRKILP
jgi:hypothetical protein